MRSSTRPLLLAGGAALAAALAGCGISDPYNAPATATQPTPAQTAAQAPVTIERPGMAPVLPGAPPPRSERIAAEALSADAAETIERYAELTGTWTWETVAANYRRAAALSLDGARATAASAAQQIPQDPRYRTEEVRQRTRLEGILQRGGTSAAPRYLVVQQRRIELRATEPSNAWLITIAVLRRVDGRWAVSSWRDQG